MARLLGFATKPWNERSCLEERSVEIDGYQVRLKVVNLPDGSRRSKPEADDVRAVAEATGANLCRCGPGRGFKGD